MVESFQISGGSISKTSFASSGGVKTSSLLRFARQVKTSGLYARSSRLLIALHLPVIGEGVFLYRGGDVGIDFGVVLPVRMRSDAALICLVKGKEG